MSAKFHQNSFIHCKTFNITSDKGQQFVSDLWPQLLDMIGAKAAHITVCHSQANGIVERFHLKLKASLEAKLNTSNWFNKLPLVLLPRTAHKEDIGCSAAEMVYGQTFQLPGKIF